MSGSSKKTLNDAVESALARIAARFDELNVPYAVLGAVALSRQGYRRYTEDVDILVRGDDLKAIHGALVGHGYRPVFAGSKNLRDTTDGVKVEFVRAGDYPGDGEEKPISFPDPTASQESHDSIHFVDLRTLVELKLASGMTSTDRLKDLADVQELIQARLLPREFAQELHEYVREKYLELWDAAFGRPKKSSSGGTSGSLRKQQPLRRWPTRLKPLRPSCVPCSPTACSWTRKAARATTMHTSSAPTPRLPASTTCTRNPSSSTETTTPSLPGEQQGSTAPHRQSAAPRLAWSTCRPASPASWQ